MAEITTLRAAVSELIQPGDTVALEGFTHLIPFEAGAEIIRQSIRDLTLVRLTPDLIADQLIGVGAVRELIFSWGGNPGVGSLHRLRDAIENAWPNPLLIEEHSHAGLVNRYTAGASGLPFATLRAYVGTSLMGQHGNIKTIACPFTGEELAAVPALNPDVAVVHAQQADRMGNVMIWGISGVQKEAILASRRSLVTVEEIVDELIPRPTSLQIPSFAIDAVALVPHGAWPSYASGYYDRDNDFYINWDAISRDRQTFNSWIKRHIYEAHHD
ncbi:CoA-transferase [Ferrimicrobium sp.]|uniref:CoA transferase subunit A n=1 Tax=Ferrimicrobium sp. TaxID=2926050 RepID=UPI002633331D|nr:CoA-transferase [Ferrimicrobium sp.]